MPRVVVFLLLLATVPTASFAIEGVKSAPAASGKLTGLPPLQTMSMSMLLVSLLRSKRYGKHNASTDPCGPWQHVVGIFITEQTLRKT